MVESGVCVEIFWNDLKWKFGLLVLRIRWYGGAERLFSDFIFTAGIGPRNKCDQSSAEKH